MADPYIGEIRLFPYDFVPAGYCLCNGQVLNEFQSSLLFSLIGRIYDQTAKSPNFKIPDLQGRTAVGMGMAPGGELNWKLADKNGSEAITLTQAQCPSHAHTLSIAVGTGAQVNASAPAAGDLMGGVVPQFFWCAPAAQINSALSPSALTPFSGGGNAHENRQPFLVLLPCIALEGEYPSFP